MDKGEFGSANNHYLTALYDHAVSLDVDADLLLQGIGIAKHCLRQPGERIPTEKLAELQNTIWDWVADESMGVLERPIPRGTYFMMGRLTIHESSLARCLKLAVRFYNMVTQSSFVTLESDAENACLKFHLPDLSRDYKFLFAEMCLLAWHRYASWYIADMLPLVETRFPYSPPGHVGEYHYLYPGKHSFEHQDLALVFPRSYLDKPCKQNYASLKTFMLRCPLELFRQYKADYSFSAELKRIIAKELHNSDMTISVCANQLFMTSRTLMRRLKEEGTTFQKVKDLVRRDRAIYYLTQKNIAVTEVAERIGYSDPTVFARAFKSWTGKTPRDFKQSLTEKA